MGHSSKSRRILHVVGGMNRGGVETWLMHVLRHIDRHRFQLDFLVHTDEACAYDQEIRRLGSCIIPCMHPRQPLQYARRFKRILHEHGPYDIVHSHVHHYSGYILRLARQVGVPVRIAHSHNDTARSYAEAGYVRLFYLKCMRRWIATSATARLACSNAAGKALYGSPEESLGTWHTLFYGIDLRPFQNANGLAHRCRELDIPQGCFVLGHVGRFDEQKNHTFLIDIAKEVIQRHPNTRLLLVGDGPLRTIIEKKVTEVGLAPYVIFAGSRSDVPELMLNEMDVFVFPSLFEGLGLVLIEAQAAGLPCIISDAVPEEAEVMKPLVRRLKLSEPASVWAEAVLSARDVRKRAPRAESLAMVLKSPFNIDIGVKNLERVYTESCSY